MRLGLGAYEEGSSSDEDSDNDDRREDRSDSDAELRVSGRSKRRNLLEINSHCTYLH